MFEGSLVESSPLLRSRNHWPAVLSTTFYTVAALALVSLPMFHPEVLSLRTPSLVYFVPPPRPVPPPPERVHIITTPTTSTTASYAPPTLAHNPSLIPTTPSATEEAPNLNPVGISMGTSAITPGIASAGSSSVHVVPASSGSGGPPNARVNISRGVFAGLLLAPIQPIYPRIAIAAHREGIVIVQAIISKTGQIESAHVISGDVMLQSAALEAVRSAHYRPYLLNGEPTEVDTTFNINFRLGGS